MLLIYAEVDRIIKSKTWLGDLSFRLPSRDSSDRDLKNIKKVKQVFKHIGILKLVGQNLEIIPDRQDVINWRVSKGKKSEGDKTETILEVVDKNLGGKVAKKFGSYWVSGS